MTKSNEHEAQFIVQICRHLMLQQYEPSQVTILTTYIGQMFLIKKVFESHSKVVDFQLSTLITVDDARRVHM